MEVALNEQVNIHSFCGKGNENHELGTGFSYIKESYQQLRRWSLLVTECHTQY
jgi:hypothetical protein